MTTAATIEHYRKKAIGKMLNRLESVGLTVLEGRILYGSGPNGDTDSGVIFSPSGSTAWTIPELLNLLDMIATHGRPTHYRVRFRNQFRTWGGTMTVQAGKIAMDEAARHAEMCSAELLECVRME